MARPLNEWPSAHRGWLLLIAGAIGLLLLWLAVRAIRVGSIEPGLLSEKLDGLPNRPIGVVLSEELAMRREVTGSVQSRVSIEAASRVAARITKVNVRAGDRVTRGQVIVVLDASELRARLRQAEGQLAAARAELGRAAAEEGRFSALFARGSATASERDAAEAAYRAAMGRTAQARAAIAAARAELEYTIVRAPVDGLVVERLAEPGDIAMPGRPLVRLYEENVLRVELEVPEELTRDIRIGTPLDVSVDANGMKYRTQVNEIVPASDPGSRSFLVRAPLPSGQRLQPGMFARATFAIANEMVLTVPRGAIEEVGQLETVRVVSDGKITTRIVSLGRSFGDRVEVLAGLHQGQRVILDSRGAGVK